MKNKIYAKAQVLLWVINLTEKVFYLENKHHISLALFLLSKKTLLCRSLGIRYLKKISSIGSRESNYMIGLFYRDGIFFPKSKYDAAWWFHKGAIMGHSLCQMNLGILYENGLPVNNIENEYKFHLNYNRIYCSKSKSLYWFEKGAKQNCARSMAHAGRLLRDEGSKSHAFYYLNKASRMGDPIAKYIIAKDFLKKNHNISPIQQQYVRDLLESSHRSGFLKSTYLLGFMFENGIGNNKNLYKAYEYYFEATKANIPAAHRKVGIFLLHGIAVKKNRPRALTFLLRAKGLGDEIAAELLRNLDF